MDRSEPQPRRPVSGSLDSTSRLFEQIREGDASAREALFARIGPALGRWAHRRLPMESRSLHDTEDLVQISLVRAFQKMEEFESRGQGSFLAYARQILLNAIRDEMRRAARSPEVRNSVDSEHEDPRPSALEAAIGSETLRRYEEALARLKPEHQEAVVLRIELDQSYAEIAEVLGLVSTEAARKAVGRAVARLAEEMRDVG